MAMEGPIGAVPILTNQTAIMKGELKRSVLGCSTLGEANDLGSWRVKACVTLNYVCGCRVRSRFHNPAPGNACVHQRATHMQCSPAPARSESRGHLSSLGMGPLRCVTVVPASLIATLLRQGCECRARRLYRRTSIEDNIGASPPPQPCWQVTTSRCLPAAIPGRSTAYTPRPRC